MSGAKRSTWIGGTVFVALVIMLAAWFFAVSPTMSAAAEVRSEAEQTREMNEILDLKVDQLKADFAKLPEYQAELAGIQLQIPTDAMLADYLRQLDQIAVAHSVALTTVTPSIPQTVVLAAPVVTAAPEPAPTEGTEGTEGSADGVEAPPAPAPGAGGPTGFTAIPLSLTVIGTYDNTLAFLNSLQNGTQRLFLVTGFTGTAQKEGDASSGRPATAVGDQELVIAGYTYVLPDALAVPETTDPAAAPVAPPAAVPGKNPLVPVSGS
ncbi:hypothetical protein [Cellulomonas sp. Leaf334]|uniref:hypothetical protein n=1 Tax=Cellulomonas sp. Leaf334 TaxID=1736339 RepID=UPI0006F52526|nr:hypothetical protein [Cellulomonas sp. Leaf334]KQR16194.1 hypothetical protein ASF78_01870 [Cellulomonas sp. Leaf334]